MRATATELLAHSALIIAQEWVPSEFDWRIGIIDRKVLFVARYGFPSGHWQIIQRDEKNRKISEGYTQAVRVDDAPPEVVGLALKAANLVPADTLHAKLVLSGEVKAAYTVSGVGVTKGARAAIEAAGGKVVEASA